MGTVIPLSEFQGRVAASRRHYPFGGASVTAFPKPQARIVDPKAGIEKIAREGVCRGCGGRGGYWGLNRAHIVSRGQRGDDVDANMIPLCGSGSVGCHGLMHSHADGWRIIARRIRESLSAEEVEYVKAAKGDAWEDWLDEAYPKGINDGSRSGTGA